MCPLCGSDQISEKINEENIYEPFAGYKIVKLTYHSCGLCGTEGDFTDNNDQIIQEAIEGLKEEAVRNILHYFQESNINLAGMERALDLPQRTLTKWKNGHIKPSASGTTLLKFIRLFPWLLAVAEKKFDFDQAQKIHIQDGINQFISQVKSHEWVSVSETKNVEFHFHFESIPNQILSLSKPTIAIENY